MTAVAVGITVVGAALAIALGLKYELDAVAIVILGLIVGAGSLVIGVVRKTWSGSIEPGQCSQCGGLISPRAPYCKHCGATVAESFTTEA